MANGNTGSTHWRVTTSKGNTRNIRAKSRKAAEQRARELFPGETINMRPAIERPIVTIKGTVIVLQLTPLESKPGSSFVNLVIETKSEDKIQCSGFTVEVSSVCKELALGDTVIADGAHYVGGNFPPTFRLKSIKKIEQ